MRSAAADVPVNITYEWGMHLFMLPPDLCHTCNETEIVNVYMKVILCINTNMPNI